MKRFILLIIFISFFTATYSQIANNWVFGYNIGLNFGSPTPTFFPTTITDRYCGYASSSDSLPAAESNSISDCSGNLLFYCNGNTIWNKFHSKMPNCAIRDTPPGLNVIRNVKILKFPNNDSLYYLFYTTEAYGLRYDIVNMNADSGRGNIISNHNFINGNFYIGSPELIKHANDTDYWLVSKANANEIFAYLITTSGISLTPVISTAGGLASNRSQLKASLSGNYLLYSDFKSPFSFNSAKCCNFNRTNGMVSNIRTLFTYSDFPGNSPFLRGVEFSPNDSFLYAITIESNKSRITQFKRYLTNPGAFPIELNFANLLFQAIQLAPDGKIYLANNNQTFLSCITRPDEVSYGCNYIYNYIDFAPRIINGGFPSVNFKLNRLKFATNAYNKNSCIVDSVHLYLQGDTTFLNYRWYIFNSSNLLVDSTDIKNPVLWLDDGIYKVKLRAQNPQCYSYTWWTDDIYVNHIPRLNITIDSTHITCSRQFLKLKYQAQFADSVSVDWKDGSPILWLPSDSIGYLTHNYFDSSHIYNIVVNIKNTYCNSGKTINDTVALQLHPQAKFVSNNSSKTFPIKGCTPLLVSISDSSKNANLVWYVSRSSNNKVDSFTETNHIITDTGWFDITQFATNIDGCIDSFIVKNAVFIASKPTLTIAQDSIYNLCLQNNIRLKITSAFNDSISIDWGDDKFNLFNGNINGLKSDTITHYYSGAGNYTIRVKSKNAYCDTSTSINHLVRPAFQLITSNATSICRGNLISIWASATGGDSVFSYILIDSISTLQNSSDLFLVAPLTTTKYKLGAINTCAKDTLWKIVTITVKPALTLTLNTIDTTLCKGNTFTIKAVAKGGNSNYLFSLKRNGITLQSNASGSFNIKVTGNESYIVQVTDHCTLPDDSMAVAIKIFPDLHFTQPLTDIYLCEAESTTLKAFSNKGSGTVSYQWMDDTGAPLSSTDSLVLSPLTSKKIILKIADACTSIFDTSWVYVFPTVANNILSTDVQSGCTPLLVNFESPALTFSNTLDYEASWDFGDGNTLIQNFTASTNILKAKHSYLSAGVYTVNLNLKFKNSSKTCLNFSTMVEALTPPQIQLMLSPKKVTLPNTLCTANIMTTNADSVVIDWGDGWSDNFNSGVGQFTQTHDYTDTGHYTVKATAFNKYSCYEEAYDKVYHADTFMCFIPNAFTPNRDNLNEAFKPVMSFCKSYEITIYNRWGEIVYEASYTAGSTPPPAWNGADYPSETYLYILSAKDGDNYRHTYKGTVILLR